MPDLFFILLCHVFNVIILQKHFSSSQRVSIHFQPKQIMIQFSLISLNYICRFIFTLTEAADNFLWSQQLFHQSWILNRIFFNHSDDGTNLKLDVLTEKNSLGFNKVLNLLVVRYFWGVGDVSRSPYQD